SVLQLLERSPGVFVDRYNGSIGLNGRTGVTILLNGKRTRLPPQALLASLASMSADRVEKIELLTSPGARYDADGTAGLINIVLRQKVETGTHASANVFAGYGYGPKAGGGLRWQHGRNDRFWHATYSYLADNGLDGYAGSADQTVPATGPMTLAFSSRNASRNRGHDYGIGWESHLNNGSALGLSLQGRDATNKLRTTNEANYDFTTGDPLSSRAAIERQDRWRHLNPSLFYRTPANTGLEFSADYLRFRNDNPSVVSNEFRQEDGVIVSPGGVVFTPAVRGASETDIDIFSIRMDYERSVGKRWEVSAGLKGASTAIRNFALLERFQDDEWIADDRSRNELQVQEILVAAYTSLQWRPTERINLVAGGRFEYWGQDFGGVVLDRKTGRFFPSLSLTHRADEEAGEWQLGYSRRITRPHYNDLAAGLTYSGPLSVFAGNPLLRPTLSHQLRLAYARGGKLVSLTWQRETNLIAPFQTSADATSELIVISPQNVDYQRSLDVQLTFPLTLTDWWTAQLTATGSLRRFRVSHTPVVTTHQYAALNLNGSHTFTLPKGFGAELSGWYLSGPFNGSVRLRDFGALNLGISKQLPGRAGKLQLSWEDVLQTNRVTFLYGSLTREAYDIMATGIYLPETARTPVLRLSYSRDFGGGENRTVRVGRATEEKGRVRQ
ncbi:MAG: outer membrane beta-barrel protein, partial [Bacteroidota bacterium]